MNFEENLARFNSGSPMEYIETLINGQHNWMINQLEVAHANKLDSLLILGIHAVIENLNEYVFQIKGIEGFKFYLKNFVDGEEPGLKYSLICAQINTMRNIIAHQFFSKLGHSFAFDRSLRTGYLISDGELRFNPSMYFDQFKSAFLQGGKTQYRVHDYQKFITEDTMIRGKKKFLESFNRW